MSSNKHMSRRQVLRLGSITSSGILLGGTVLVGNSQAGLASYGVITNIRGFGEGVVFELTESLGEKTIECPRRGGSSITGQEFETDVSSGRGSGSNIVLKSPGFEVGDTLEVTQYSGAGTCNQSWAFLVVRKIR